MSKKNNDKKQGEFFTNRMAQLGVTEDNNRIYVTNPEAEFPAPSRISIPIFQEDKDGNIVINFYDLESSLISYYKKGKGKMSALNQKAQTWQQIRLQHPSGDNKYKMPSGQGTFPFQPPLLLDKWAKKEEIETLVLTEGAFKAWLSCLKGIATVGLTSITHYRDSETGGLHKDIIKLIIDCKVKNVVILWDGDCLDISTSQLHDKVDITKRPAGFFYSAKAIRDLIEEIEYPEEHKKPQVIYKYINSQSFEGSPKGLDDLIISMKGDAQKIESIKAQLLDCTKSKSMFFYQNNITSSTSSLKKHFRLNNAEAFYFAHSDILQNYEYNYLGDIYAYSEQSNGLEIIAPEYAKSIKWIGDNFYKIVDQPTAFGDKVRILSPRKKGTLTELYGKKFTKYLKYYDGFCNIPNHFEYKPEHESFYNLYSPFTHIPAEGKCTETINFFKHIFGERVIEREGKKYKAYQLGLDYIQLLITKPTQILPVLILFSKENGTGKSTFGKWQKLLLGHNAIQVGNNDFKSDFNEHWTPKLLAICEETLLERKKEAEGIKAYATSTRITVNPKGTAQFEMDFFCKFQFYSNSERMIYVTEYDQRFWINTVPVPKKDNPNILQKLEKEIPAFLHYILNRKLVTKNESRMHFHHELLKTKMLKKVVEKNEPQDAANLRENIKEMFIDSGIECKEILMPMNNIKREFFSDSTKIPWLKEILHDYIKVDKLKDEKTGKDKQVRGSYIRKNPNADVDIKLTISFNGRPYLFRREYFVNAEDEVVIEEETTGDLSEL